MLTDINEIEKLEKIGEGKCSDVYKDGNIVYKVLNEVSKLSYGGFYNRKNSQDLISATSDICIYPFDYLVDENGELKAYVMNYIPMIKMGEMIRKLTFEELKEVMQNAEDKIKKEVKGKMIFNDVHGGNIVWNTERQCIQISDVDFFIKNPMLSEQYIYGENSYSFYSAIKDIFYLEIHDIYEYLLDNEEMNKYKKEQDIKNTSKKPVSANEYIFKMRQILEREFGIIFNNIGEMEEAVKRKKELEEQDDDNPRKKFADRISNNGEYREKDFTKSIIDKPNYSSISHQKKDNLHEGK